MKTIKKIILFILFITLGVGVLASCSKAKKLDTPSVVIKENVIQWTKINNASGYELHIGSQVITLTDTTYAISELKAGTYDIYVIATTKSKKYENSNKSTIISYTHKTKSSRLDAPVIAIDGNVVSWQAIENAESYDVYVGLNKTNTTSTSITLENLTSGQSIYVIAIASRGYTNSIASNIVKYNHTSSALDYNQVSLLKEITADLDGTFGEVMDLVNERQLYDTSLWSRFVCQFRSNTDGDGYGWRGEFWGKMMEGACITYESTKDEKLYKILTNTVEDLLTTQQADGGITSYGNPTTDEDSDVFCGWDMWCRRWTLQGLVYYYNICKDENLKERILKSLCRQLDCILKVVGDGEGKININDACSQWGGLPTSTILEVVCNIYQMTNKKEYLDFATHIVNNGGSKYGNQIEQAIQNTTLPYTWGAPKAGELATFFDGVLEYYYLTGIEKYKTAAVNFWYAVNESELTIVGGGCTKDEVFEHSAVEQADPRKTGAQQEFCVTIHWLNFSKDIYQLTNDVKVLDSMERTIYNAVLCCVDNEHHYDHVFNSYNNLIYNKRTTSAAGGMQLHEPYEWSYGCCISQGSIATGLIPQIQYATANQQLLVNMFFPGVINGKLDSGSNIKLTMETAYPKEDEIKLIMGLEKKETFDLSIRIPSWSNNTKVMVNGEEIAGAKAGTYFTINREWNNNDEITIKLQMDVIELWGSKECSYENGQNMVALARGPITFARDARLDNGEIFDTVEFVKNSDGTVKYTLSNTASFENIIEIEVELTNGKKIHLVNYGNAGKTFDFDSMFTTFMPTTDYWKVDIENENGVIITNNEYQSVLVISEKDGYLHTGNAVSDYQNLSKFAVKFVSTNDGYYNIIHMETGKYLTVVQSNNDFYFQYLDGNGTDNQKFRLDHAGLLSYTITCKISNYIMSANNETEPIWLYSNCGSPKQYWTITLLEDFE